ATHAAECSRHECRTARLECQIDRCVFYSFFFNDTATTEIYTLSLHDALPISAADFHQDDRILRRSAAEGCGHRSEEHTSELQSLTNLVCRLLLEKKKSKN